MADIAVAQRIVRLDPSFMVISFFPGSVKIIEPQRSHTFWITLKAA
jgi:hypothetical protein